MGTAKLDGLLYIKVIQILFEEAVRKYTSFCVSCKWVFERSARLEDSGREDNTICNNCSKRGHKLSNCLHQPARRQSGSGKILTLITIKVQINSKVNENHTK